MPHTPEHVIVMTQPCISHSSKATTDSSPYVPQIFIFLIFKLTEELQGEYDAQPYTSC